MHSPDPVGDSKLSLGSLAKTTATLLQSLRGSEHHCMPLVQSEDASSYSPPCHSFKGFRFFFPSDEDLLLGTGIRRGHSFNFSD